MDARESQVKVSKNKFRAFVEQRKALKKKEVVKKVLSPEKLAAKAAGLEAFLRAKAAKKLRRVRK